MANKLFLVSATLAFFFLLTNASIYRTIVEFDEDDNQSGPFRPFRPQQQQKCRKEFQQAQHLQACQQWMHQKATQQGGGSSWALDDEFDFDNQQGPEQRPQLLQQCCNELRREDEECVCPTLKQAARAVRSQVQQQGQQGQSRPQVTRRIFQTAKHLPDVCDIPQVSVCPFNIPRSY
ncbi:napin-2-like [Eutrema salsugineum]|uniref:napin-2-like n=1 Tax=Eutrema salsugineum TaxID=72664 RepID=UPI000CED5FB4|nr:napin-2-like [Eutrema salsugineum]